MDYPEETVRAWMKIIDHHLRRYRSHVDFEDIVATAYLTLARLLRSPLWERDGGGIGLILTCVNRAVVDFLESPQNRLRRYNRDRKPAVQWVSLSRGEGPGARGQATRTPDWPLSPVPSPLERSDWLCPHVPDFVPPLLDRLEVERRLSRFPPRKRAALLLHCYHGCSYAEVARALGVTERQARRACAGFKVPGTMQRGGR